MIRYARAFVKALQMTLNGETITPSHFKPLEDWIDRGMQILAQIITTADTNGMTLERRQTTKLKLDGRMTSLEQSLQMVRHNFTTEYPKLIQLDDAYTMMVVQSSNMNDQYRISQFVLSDDVTSPDIKQALEQLSDHLINLPAIEIPDTNQQ